MVCGKWAMLEGKGLSGHEREREGGGRAGDRAIAVCLGVVRVDQGSTATDNGWVLGDSSNKGQGGRGQEQTQRGTSKKTSG